MTEIRRLIHINGMIVKFSDEQAVDEAIYNELLRHGSIGQKVSIALLHPMAWPARHRD